MKHSLVSWGVRLVALAMVLLLARLGVWQLDRAGQKQAQHRLVQAQALKPVIPMCSWPRQAADLPALWQRRVELRGRWLNEASVFLDNRPMNGRQGFEVLTPLTLEPACEGGPSVVMVLRGWAPRNLLDRSALPTLPPAPEVVSVQGLLMPEPSRLLELGEAASQPERLRQNLHLSTVAKQLGQDLAPFIVRQSPNPSLNDGLLRDWAEPSSGVERHWGYAFQWFSLSALLALLTVWFQFIKPWRERRKHHHPSA